MKSQIGLYLAEIKGEPTFSLCETRYYRLVSPVFDHILIISPCICCFYAVLICCCCRSSICFTLKAFQVFIGSNHFPSLEGFYCETSVGCVYNHQVMQGLYLRWAYIGGRTVLYI